MRRMQEKKKNSPLLRQLCVDKSMRIRSSKISQRDFKEILRRDLERLLNSKSAMLNSHDISLNVAKSCLNYGMFDFMRLDYASESGQFELCQHIRQLIIDFEKRIKEVNVSIDNQDNVNAVLYIKITGVIHIELEDISLCFETLLNPEYQSFTVIQGYTP